MLDYIKTAADEVGISAFVTNSENRIETQLNSLTRGGDLPIMLVSWDLDVELSFDESGFMNNPDVSVVVLLVTKPGDMSKNEAEDKAQEMGKLFEQFLQKLHSKLIVFQKQAESPISGASYKLVPRHGAGKHSGVLGKFSMKSSITNC